MASNLDELEALAMIQEGGYPTVVASDDVKCDKVEEPSWTKADLKSFCEFLGVSTSTLKFFTRVIDNESHPSIRLLPTMKAHSGSTTDQHYLRAFWCQAEGFELLDPLEIEYILPTIVVELLRMTEHLLNTESSMRRVAQRVRTEYRELYRKVRYKKLADFCRKKSLEAFMNSI